MGDAVGVGVVVGTTVAGGRALVCAGVDTGGRVAVGDGLGTDVSVGPAFGIGVGVGRVVETGVAEGVGTGVAVRASANSVSGVAVGVGSGSPQAIVRTMSTIVATDRVRLTYTSAPNLSSSQHRDVLSTRPGPAVKSVPPEDTRVDRARKQGSG